MNFKESIKGLFNKKPEDKESDKKIIGGGEVFVGLFKNEETNKELEKVAEQDRVAKILDNFEKDI